MGSLVKIRRARCNCGHVELVQSAGSILGTFQAVFVSSSRHAMPVCRFRNFWGRSEKKVRVTWAHLRQRNQRCDSPFKVSDLPNMDQVLQNGEKHHEREAQSSIAGRKYSEINIEISGRLEFSFLIEQAMSMTKE